VEAADTGHSSLGPGGGVSEPGLVSRPGLPRADLARTGGDSGGGGRGGSRGELEQSGVRSRYR
jgi:hypothetical protein